MTLCVVDASVALAWTIESQSTDAARELRAKAGGFDLIAPSIFRLEVRNALLKAERRRLIARADVDAAIATIEALGVACGSEPGDEELDIATSLSRATRLSLYDALYLLLAQTEGAALASRDASLLAAAQARGLWIEDCR